MSANGPKYELYRRDPITGGLAKVEMAKLTAPLLQSLGIEGGADTLRRLSRAGFIRLVKISPGVEQLDCASLTAHLAACEADPDKWDDDGESTREYLFRNALGGWKKPAAEKPLKNGPQGASMLPTQGKGGAAAPARFPAFSRPFKKFLGDAGECGCEETPETPQNEPFPTPWGLAEQPRLFEEEGAGNAGSAGSAGNTG